LKREKYRAAVFSQIEAALQGQSIQAVNSGEEVSELFAAELIQSKSIVLTSADLFPALFDRWQTCIISDGYVQSSRLWLCFFPSTRSVYRHLSFFDD
jgi:hypothetical protein